MSFKSFWGASTRFLLEEIAEMDQERNEKVSEGGTGRGDRVCARLSVEDV